MGTRLLKDFSTRFLCKGLFGKSGLNRLQRDILNYGDVEYVYANSATKDMYDNVRVTNFINLAGTLGKLKIKKTLDNINDATVNSKEFKFKVERK